MNAVDLLEQARALGVDLIPLPGGGLKLRGKPPRPAKLKAALKERKAEILTLIESRRASVPPCDALAAAYQFYWTLPETEPLEQFQAAHREIARLDAQGDSVETWATLRKVAATYHVRKGTCPFCRERGELHLPAHQLELELKSRQRRLH